MKSNGSVKVHPAADMFPMMDEESFQHLKADIAKYGQRDDVVFYRGMLVDGRNRWRACEELGIECEAMEFEDDTDTDMYAFVVSQNLHRRHLTTSQRTMIAARMANLKHGGDRKSDDIKVSKDTLIDDAAKMLKVSRPSVCRAKKVIENGSRDLVAAVERGDVPVSLAAKLVDECDDKKTQSQLAKNGAKAIRQFITPTSDYIEEPDEPAAVEAKAEPPNNGVMKQFMQLWNDADPVGRAAIYAFVTESYHQ